MKSSFMKKGLKVKCLIMAAITLSGASFCGCGDDSYRNTLSSGLQKYYSGESMNKSEYNAVKSYNNWKSNQGSKSYNDWGG